MLNLLIVDDSINIRFFIKKVLSSLEIKIGEVFEASDGVDAISKLLDNNIDVVLTDINMPKMNGLELTQTIKSDPRYDQIKVIIEIDRSI